MHGTLIPTRIALRKFLYKSLLNSAERDSLSSKNRNIDRYQTTNLLKTLYLCLVCKKGQTEGKSEFGTKFVGIIVTIIFM